MFLYVRVYVVVYLYVFDKFNVLVCSRSVLESLLFALDRVKIGYCSFKLLNVPVVEVKYSERTAQKGIDQ